jgi:hypothetical protein
MTQAGLPACIRALLTKMCTLRSDKGVHEKIRLGLEFLN